MFNVSFTIFDVTSNDIYFNGFSPYYLINVLKNFWIFFSSFRIYTGFDFDGVGLTKSFTPCEYEFTLHSLNLIQAFDIFSNSILSQHLNASRLILLFPSTATLAPFTIFMQTTWSTSSFDSLMTY